MNRMSPAKNVMQSIIPVAASKLIDIVITDESSWC